METVGEHRMKLEISPPLYVLDNEYRRAVAPQPQHRLAVSAAPQPLRAAQQMAQQTVQLQIRGPVPAQTRVWARSHRTCRRYIPVITR